MNADDWDGYEMVCRVIRQADLVEFLEKARAHFSDGHDRDPGVYGLHAVCDSLAARSLVEDATTFLKALGHKED